MTTPTAALPASAMLAAHELLRCALLAKLALDLDDLALARRAALQAQPFAAQLAELVVPERDEVLETHCGRADLSPRTLGGLLRELYPTPDLEDVDDAGEAA